jgi:hypothetical protein
MFELKLQQKLLQTKLAALDSKADKLNRVVLKKMSDKKSTMYIGAPAPADTLHVGNHIVSDFIISNRLKGGGNGTVTLPALTAVGLGHHLSGVTTIGFGSNVDSIRLRHMQRTEGKREIAKRTKEKAEAEASKAPKKKRTFDTRSVPASMFPDRYIRGELPCSIEHGKGGAALNVDIFVHYLFN